MMRNRREQFLEHVRALERAMSGDRFDLVQSSGLVRALFLDGPNSLVDQVNREARVRLLFDVATAPPPPPVASMVGYFMFAPGSEWPNARGRVQMPRNQFFGMDAGFSAKGGAFRVSDLVRYAAHVLGGVHYGQPEKPPDHVIDGMLAEFDDLAPGMGDHAPIHFLRNVDRIVVDALMPLVAKLQ